MATATHKLAIFAASLRGGGAERSMLNLSKDLTARGFAVDLLLASKVGPYLAEVPAEVRVVDLGGGRVLKSLFPLVRYLRSEQPAALLSAMNHVNIVALWARRLAGVRTRVVISERNFLTQWSRNSSKRIDRLVLPRLMRCFYPWADGIVAVSEGVGDDLARCTRIPRRQIRAIYNPVARAELFERTAAPLDHPWFQPGQPPVLLAAGRLHVQKDFPTLIRAFEQVRRQQPVRLLILGEGPQRPALEQLVEELGLTDDVALPGFAANPYAYMARAAAFVLASRWEGLPGVLIEAMCCGAPVIATDCPSGPREILRDGQYGQLVPVGDVPALAAAVQTVLNHPDPRPPRESVCRFEPDTVVDQYLSVLLGPTTEELG